MHPRHTPLLPGSVPVRTIYRSARLQCQWPTIARNWWRKSRAVSPDAKLIDLQAVRQRLSLQKSSIYAGIRQEIIPPPVKLGHASRWFDDEISELLGLIRSDRESTRVND